MSAIDCRTAGLLSSVELDGELSAAEAAALSGHLAACEACVRRRRVLGETWRVVTALPLEPVSDGFDDGVSRRAARGTPVRWTLAAAALLALGLLVPHAGREPDGGRAPSGGPTPRVSVEIADPGVGIDCGLPGATRCVTEAAVVVLARPNVAFTASP